MVVDWGDAERVLAPGVSVLMGADDGRYPSGNSLLVRGAGEAVVIDPSVTVVERGGVPAPVDAIVNSHSHEDHLAGNGLFADARVHVHHHDLPGVRSLDGLMAVYGLTGQPRIDFTPTVLEEFHYAPRPDAEGFSDGHVFDLGGVTIEAVHLPGHTRGHSGFRISGGVFFLSDIDLTGFGPYCGDAWSDLDDFESSLAKVRDEIADAYVTFHHRGVIESRARFVRLVDEFAAVIDRRHAAMLDFLTRARSIDDMVAHRFIYRPHVQLAYTDTVERRCAELHVQRMLSRGEAVEAEPGRFQRAAWTTSCLTLPRTDLHPPLRRGRRYVCVVANVSPVSSYQLRRFAKVTDPDLARLIPSELLDELLSRVERLLRVDTVAVLLLDRAGTHLVVASARGLEEEILQGVRLPVGHGFAGRIAATKAPMVLDKIGPDTVVNPMLWRRGVKAMLGVPVIAGGTLLGVMHVGSLRSRRFSDDDSALLQMAADRIATALSAQQAAAERSAARTLQLSLMPTRLPSVDGLEFATRFVAAEDFGVGGDWFDAFKLPDGQIGIVVGDVAGSGLRAAVVMGRLRSALRAYAIESASPAEALDRLRRKFAHFEPDEMATVLYLTIAADLTSFTLSSTGHPPPVMAVPGQSTVILGCSPSPPIGAHMAARKVDVIGALPTGATVACYTDGLIERRGESLDRGLERLRRVLYPGPPEEVCASVMAELIGSTPVEDDTALLVFRRGACAPASGTTRTRREAVPSFPRLTL